LLIALAWSGYFLNLFNLAPVGMLDGALQSIPHPSRNQVEQIAE
jgi:Zn-dependent protease